MQRAAVSPLKFRDVRVNLMIGQSDVWSLVIWTSKLIGCRKYEVRVRYSIHVQYEWLTFCIRAFA